MSPKDVKCLVRSLLEKQITYPSLETDDSIREGRYRLGKLLKQGILSPSLDEVSVGTSDELPSPEFAHALHVKLDDLDPGEAAQVMQSFLDLRGALFAALRNGRLHPPTLERGESALVTMLEITRGYESAFRSLLDPQSALNDLADSTYLGFKRLPEERKANPDEYYTWLEFRCMGDALDDLLGGIREISRKVTEGRDSRGHIQG